ncbi:hypothetical protein CL656_04525, partial [bacterium]|nr:hypothetical protein [bacterium]
MLLDLKVILMNKLLFIILCSIVFSNEGPKFIFNNGQSALCKYMVWDELESEYIRYNYILPSQNISFHLTQLNNFYNNWHKFLDMPLWFKVNLDLSTNDFNTSRQKMTGTYQYQISNSLAIQNSFEFDSDGRNDAHFRDEVSFISFFSKSWSVYIQHSSLSYNYTNGHFLIGKGNLYSSIFNNSILINPNFPPVPYIWWHHKENKSSFDWGLKSLDEINSNNRLLIFHRYSYIDETWSLGLTEMTIMKYENLNQHVFQYSLPSAILFENEYNSGDNTNIMLSID